MESIDKITLELLMNKTSYNKYLEKTDSSKFKEQQDFHQKIQKYKSRISSVLEQYLENPGEFLVTLEINEMLETYAKTCIQHFEITDMNMNTDDVLFDPPSMSSSTDAFTVGSSFWSKDKVFKQNHF